MASESYVSSYCSVPLAPSVVIERELAGLTGHDSQFARQVIVGYFTQPRKIEQEGGIPISSKWIIKKHFRKYRYDNVKHLIKRSGYSRLKKESRVYSLQPGFEKRIREANDLSDEERATSPMFDIVSGKRVTRPRKGRLTDENNRRLPYFIREAINRFNHTYVKIDLAAIQEHIERLRQEEIAARERLEEAESWCHKDHEAYKKVVDHYNKAHGTFLNDLYRKNSLLDRNTRFEGTDAWIIPIFSVCPTGRLYQDGGGIQGASRNMQRAAFSNDDGIHNYDLVSAHPHILLQFLEEDRFNANPLIDYLEKGRAKYAEGAGIEEKLFKKLFTPLLMCAKVPGLDWNLQAYTKNSILKTLQKWYGKDTAAMRLALEGFSEVTLPIRELIDKWATYGIEEWIYKNRSQGNAITNAVGLTKRITELEALHKRKATRKLAAFRLHGLEQAFIDALTIIGSEYSYIPLINMHDGLITLDEIPQSAVKEAMRISGLRYATLNEKPL
jgi:hypothetical protein